MSGFADLLSVKMDLANVIYISYRLPVSRIRPLIPNVLPVASDHNNNAFVSFVAMSCRRVRLSAFPWPRFNYDQLNLRTYIRDPKTGDPAVYFFQSGVSLGIIPPITHLAGIPWEKISFQLHSDGVSGYQASGQWRDDIHFEIVAPDGELPEDSVVEHLTGPMMGFMGSNGKLRSFRISHRALEVRPARLKSIEFSMPINNGLITADKLRQPDSVLMVPHAQFTVYLPPRRII